MAGADVLVVVAVTFTAVAIQTVTGFGLSLFAVPSLAFVVEPKSAVVIAASLGLVSSSSRAHVEREHCDRGAAGRMIAGGLAGAPLGLMVLAVTPERGLRFALAVAVMAFLVLNVTGFRVHSANNSLDVAAGFVGGVLSTSLSTNGPPLVAVLHARGLAPQVFRSTLAVVFATSGAVAVALFVLTGRYEREVLYAIAWAAPALVVGLVVGHRVAPRVSPIAFRRAVLALLALTAVASAVGAIVG